MNPAFSVAMQILQFLWANREEVKSVVIGIENLAAEAPGSTKAAAFKGWIAAALGIEAQVEAAWPMVAPLFNFAVAQFKIKPAPAA